MSDLESLALDATLCFLDEATRKLSGQHVYAFTYDFPPEENCLSAALGTEERLLTTVREYRSLGYGSAARSDASAGLSEWLRWSAPADGWFRCTESSAFDSFNDCLLVQLEKHEIELYGGHLIDLTKRILLDAVFERRLAELTDGRQVPKLRAYAAFSTPEVIPWARETNSPEVFEAFRDQIETWSVLDAQIKRPKQPNPV